jgi:hypothetical protein
VEVGLIDVDEDNLPATDAPVQLMELLDVGGPLFRFGLAQQLLDLLERQPGPRKGAADGAAAGAQAEGLQQPLPEFLNVPEVAGQAVVDRLAVLDGIDEPLYLVGRKRGALPPVRRQVKASGPPPL